MTLGLESQPVEHHYVAQAWELINGLGLNSKITVGSAEMMRFHLVDNEGYSQSSPAKATCIFDAYFNEDFLPQTHPMWLDDLMTRFRVNVAWNEGLGQWVASLNQEVSGQGRTPGVAVVEALVNAGKHGLKLVRHPYPDQNEGLGK